MFKLNNKANLIVISCIIFFFCLSAFNLFAYKFDFTTVSDVVKEVKDKFEKIDSYQADFKMTSEKLGNKTYRSGRVYFKNANKILVEFDQPPGQKIVSDGKTMWIYLPSMNVVAEQDLNSGGSIFFAGTKSGLNRLFAKYHYKFASKTQPEKMDDGTKKYSLYLKQKESRSGFRNIKLFISEDYYITRAYGESSTGKNVEIIFSNIKTNISLPNNRFTFDMPSKARIIKNPMISEE